jgi:hypothetical protein
MHNPRNGEPVPGVQQSSSAGRKSQVRRVRRAPSLLAAVAAGVDGWVRVGSEVARVRWCGSAGALAGPPAGAAQRVVGIAVGASAEKLQPPRLQGAFFPIRGTAFSHTPRRAASRARGGRGAALAVQRKRGDRPAMRTGAMAQLKAAGGGGMAGRRRFWPRTPEQAGPEQQLRPRRQPVRASQGARQGPVSPPLAPAPPDRAGAGQPSRDDAGEQAREPCAAARAAPCAPRRRPVLRGRRAAPRRAAPRRASPRRAARLGGRAAGPRRGAARGARGGGGRGPRAH